MPLEGLTAIYSDTSNKDESIIIGYINKNQLAEVGASRMYALGESGEVSGFVYVRASGVIELNGPDFSAVRFQPLQEATDQANSLINAELTKISAAIATLGGSYIVSNITTDLTDTESQTVKLK